MNVLSCSRTPKPPTSALPGMRRSAATDAVGLAPSLLPRLGAVAITVTTTALDRVSGVVSGDACVPGFGCGLACVRVCRWVGLALRLVCEVLVSVLCVSRLPPVSLNRVSSGIASCPATKFPRAHPIPPYLLTARSLYFVANRAFLNSAPRRLLSKEVSTEVGTVTSGSGKWHPADRAGMKRSDPVEGFLLAGILSGTSFIACVPFFSWMLTAH